MNNNLMSFGFNGKEMTTIIDEKDDPWWVAEEVCEVLGLDDVATALTEIDIEDKRNFSVSNAGTDISNLRIINEPGIYNLIFKSLKPEAKAFKKWLTKEVLPAIRKSCSYTPGNNEMTEAELIWIGLS